MRSNQLPDAIKEHLRKRQEANSRQNRERRAITRAGKSQVGSSDAGEPLGTKRSRDSDALQLRDVQAQRQPESHCNETADMTEMPDGVPYQNPESILRTTCRDQATMTPLDPRLGAVGVTAVERTMNDMARHRSASCLRNINSQAEDQPSAYTASTVSALFAKAKAQQQHRQMLALIPAPQYMETPDFGESSTSAIQHQLHEDWPSTDTLSETRFKQSQRQLSDLRTPTIQECFTGMAEDTQAEKSRQLAPEVSPHATNSLATDATTSPNPASTLIDTWGQLTEPAAFEQHYRTFRHSINTSISQINATLGVLNQYPLSGKGSRDNGTLGSNTSVTGHEMLGIAQLGQELAQRMQIFAQRVEESEETLEPTILKRNVQ